MHSHIGKERNLLATRTHLIHRLGSWTRRDWGLDIVFVFLCSRPTDLIMKKCFRVQTRLGLEYQMLHDHHDSS